MIEQMDIFKNHISKTIGEKYPLSITKLGKGFQIEVDVNQKKAEFASIVCEVELYKNKDRTNYCYLNFCPGYVYLFKRISNKGLVRLFDEYNENALAFEQKYKNYKC